ncbi:RNA recognition motif domain containing protein [Entamoeba marina]
MPKEGLEVLTDKQRLFVFPDEEIISQTEETIIENDVEKKIITKTIKVTTSINENVERRKNIVKFTKLDVTNDEEDVVLVFPSQIAQAELAETEVDEEEVKKSTDDIVCSVCGEIGHFSFECTNRGARRANANEKKAENSTTYVAPHLREQANGDMYQRDISIRVANLPPTVDETVMKALYHKIVGDEKQILRIYFPKDRVTGLPRDFCFISLATKEIAENAISKLDGYLFEFVKLSCGMAKPRKI